MNRDLYGLRKVYILFSWVLFRFPFFLVLVWYYRYRCVWVCVWCVHFLVDDDAVQTYNFRLNSTGMNACITTNQKKKKEHNGNMKHLTYFSHFFFFFFYCLLPVCRSSYFSSIFWICDGCPCYSIVNIIKQATCRFDGRVARRWRPSYTHTVHAYHHNV